MSTTVNKHKILREIQLGNVETIKRFKESCPDVHWCELRYDKTGDSIIHVASRLGYVNIVEFLVVNYEPNAVDCKNHDGKTALHEAAQFSQLEVMKVLISNGANVNALKRADWTPLMLSCTKLTCNSLKCVQLLLESGALVNYKNKDGWTALHLVCREGDGKVLDVLVSNGLEVFQVTKNGRTALHVAALHGHLDIVKKLVVFGLDVNKEDNCGNVPLHEAVLGGNVNILKFLLSSGANLMARNKSDFGVLHLAASVGSLDMIDVLVNYLKVQVNLANSSNLTPLHCAARNKQREVFDHLIKLGASDIPDNYGRLAVEYLNF